MSNSASASLNRRLVKWSTSEIRQGQLWPVTIALILIIACIFALTALAERMEQVVVKQGKQALTADTVFISSNPISESFEMLAAENELTTSSQTRFGTMAFSDNGMKLITVKAVDSLYPLQGEMVLSDDKQNYSHVKQGELWLDERLFSQLNVSVGDAVTLGDADFIVTGRIVEEPGLSFNPFQQMPSAFIHSDDIDRTGAVQLGSRVRYSKFINGDEANIEHLKSNIELTPSDRWRDQNSASRTNEVFQRTEQYLSLTVAIVVIMAATTLVLTCQHYVTTRRKTIAMLKSLGASKKWIVRWLLTQVSILLVAAVVLGVSLGVVLEYLLRIPLVELLPNPLPSYGLKPIIISVMTSILIAIPALGIPLVGLTNVSAVNVMQPQAEINGSKSRYWLVLVPIIPMLLAYYDNLLVWIVLGGIVALFAILAFVSVLVTRALGKVPLSAALKLALSRINRSTMATGIQFGALALSLMLLSTMWLVRTDLLTDWQRTLPKDAPNAFALNIAPYEKDAYLKVLDDAGILRSEDYPIIRGRVVNINGVDAKSKAEGEEGSDALRREINFTFATGIPEHNEVLSGEWTQTNGVSVEADVANDLGLKIGDELEFVINSIQIKAKVNSIRHVEWRDMKPNFYFIFTPDVLENIPATYLVSFKVEDEHDALLNQLSRQHPTVSLMDIRVMGAKIQELLGQIVWSITLLAGIGVLSGLLLIFTLLRLSLGQRQEEIQLYRTLGASKKRVEQTIWAEYGLMALVAGVIAIIGSEIVVGAIMIFGFELQPQMHWMLWILLPIGTFFTLALVVNSLIKRLLTPINKAFS
ncbi:FtsX-like permease family protein [Vibrio europaeus]|uniref:ABC transporter permease n=1 Tax=Vibrio europaeus TaxID=300876 RepID=A0A178JA32_9VIBR|nr:FtsX-like permease family protein [Vibrio europaeus]MDC5704838.1 FtsX-like permease family protein [Vibrio europaeus]MDC5710117.1 FtsX-like permease family protein [Vibrio europaeus]MDC5715207.1 FtsX-like permease family protein [Vibrio europaeus]MDC5718939.1 FtsX-like permease family protein [Vibrio europaeus]MDC5724744.1 FtsX-like permease family protein [Vibrio europaeus]